MDSPKLSLVRPRVVSPASEEVVLLEDAVESYLADHARGAVEVLGGAGSGRSTALAYIASCDFARRLVLLDDAHPKSVTKAAANRVVVYTSCQPFGIAEASYRLAWWDMDNLIEYLLARWPDRCASVMARFLADADRTLLDGRPDLLCMVADQLARDEAANIRVGLRRALAELAGNDETLHDAQRLAAALLIKDHTRAAKAARILRRRGHHRPIVRAVHSRFVQILLAAERLCMLLRQYPMYDFLAHRLPSDFVAETGRLARTDPAAIARLRSLMEECDGAHTPTAASILAAADPGWRPAARPGHVFAGACFTDVAWQDVHLSDAILDEAVFQNADLRGANLSRAWINRANLSRVQAAHANLSHARGLGTNFRGADLRYSHLSHGCFAGANFARAKLEHATARRTDFCHADFSSATLAHAVLTYCSFCKAVLKDVNMQGADLFGTDLSGQRLESADLSGASLVTAVLTGASMEYVEWPDVCFKEATLADAYLTGSRMKRADFRNASLRQAGLADIEWEDADLRSADFRGCSFHLGSSRSGLVGSPYPCHGSRTGFYTDDSGEQHFKAPEEIRKANLCGADLRGAIVEDADFYLVDLRGAKYDRQQEIHFRRCNAILESYAP